MRYWTRICIPAAVIVGLWVSVAAAADTNPAIERVANAGIIDWVGETLTASGVGSSGDKTGSPNQLRGLAERAAVVVARRNLLEVVKGIHIDAVTRVEKYLIQEDSVETRVKGLLVNSRVNRVRFLDDTTAEAIVSIPLSGDLQRALLQMAVYPPGDSAGKISPEVAQRLDALEKRVADLESRISQLQQANTDYRELTAAMLAWVEWMDRRQSTAGTLMIAGTDSADTRKVVQRQAAQIRRLAARLDAVADRLSKLEQSGTAGAAAPASNRVRYTGLVIDARGLGFKPSLKPGVFAKAGRIYPGDYVIAETAVTRGYVRFYRDIAQAQQSDRAGRLPLTVKAISTLDNSRNLAISSADHQILEAISTIPGNFLGQCKVVIVF